MKWQKACLRDGLVMVKTCRTGDDSCEKKSPENEDSCLQGLGFPKFPIKWKGLLKDTE